MNLYETLKASLFASLWLSWIAVLIAIVPILFAYATASHHRRLRYLVAGFIGAMAGGSCGVTSLFLSLWFYCRNQPSCNTAQGDMGLLVTLPVGALAGSIISLGWTRAMREVFEPTSGEDSSARGILRRWIVLAVVPACFCLIATLIAARLMA